MRKISTLFVRDPENRKHVLDEVTPGCEWVLAGEGIATRKYDGTCVLITEDGEAMARRVVKAGKEAPPNFAPVEHDETTGNTVGWEPMTQSGFAHWYEEAGGDDLEAGTYELCGPKVQGDPERFGNHVLVPHGLIELPNAPRSFAALGEYLRLHSFEGIVWHHPDGRMAKLKKRDFPAAGSAVPTHPNPKIEESDD